MDIHARMKELDSQFDDVTELRHKRIIEIQTEISQLEDSDRDIVNGKYIKKLTEELLLLNALSERDKLKEEVERLRNAYSSLTAKVLVIEDTEQSELSKLKEDVERLTIYLEKDQYKDWNKLKEENERLKSEKMLALADAQFLGFHLGKDRALIEMVSSMGLKQTEWEQWKSEYNTYPLNESEIEEINEYFISQAKALNP